MRITLAAGFALGLAAGCQAPAGPPADLRPLPEILKFDGLAAAEKALMQRPVNPETAFELGGVRFLQALESVLQVQYDAYDARVPFLPGMRAQLPPNPTAKFDPAFVETALTGALKHLEEADAALAAAKGDFGVSLPLDALWLDIDRNGKPADWESLKGLLEGMGAQVDWETAGGVIRFDAADAEWLAAYVNMMAGVSEFVLSLDPTPAIAKVSDGRKALEKAGVPTNPYQLFVGSDALDQIAAVLLTLEGKPDAKRTRKALDHFSRMIAHNRKFWPLLMAETDNDREWLPNPKQQSPFGITITDEVATGWQDVLGEIDDILAGRTLVPYSMLSFGMSSEPTDLGINIKRMLSDPPDMNAVLLLQGASIAPYLEHGKLASGDAWRRFERLMQGDGLLMAVILN